MSRPHKSLQSPSWVVFNSNECNTLSFAPQGSISLIFEMFLGTRVTTNSLLMSISYNLVRFLIFQYVRLWHSIKWFFVNSIIWVRSLSYFSLIQMKGSLIDFYFSCLYNIVSFQKVTLNSSVNFIIYCIFGEKFKKVFCKMCCPFHGKGQGNQDFVQR